MRQPYVRRPHRHKRILSARDSASKQPLCLSRFCVVKSGLVVNCACRSCDSSAQLATRDRWGPDSTPRSGRRHSESIDLGSSTAATYRPQMRARALSADVFGHRGSPRLINHDGTTSSAMTTYRALSHVLQAGWPTREVGTFRSRWQQGCVEMIPGAANENRRRWSARERSGRRETCCVVPSAI